MFSPAWTSSIIYTHTFTCIHVHIHIYEVSYTFYPVQLLAVCIIQISKNKLFADISFKRGKLFWVIFSFDVFIHVILSAKKYIWWITQYTLSASVILPHISEFTFWRVHIIVYTRPSRLPVFWILLHIVFSEFIE